MKFEPRRGQAIGRIVVRPPSSSIVRTDETKETTKFMLLDAVGPDFEEKGLRDGDVVLPRKINIIQMDGGTSVRPFVEEDDIVLIVRDWTGLDDFYVQTENGKAYVPFDDPRAAPSLGIVVERAAAAA